MYCKYCVCNLKIKINKKKKNTETLPGLGKGRIDPWSKAYAFDPPVTLNYKPGVSKERATALANI